MGVNGYNEIRRWKARLRKAKAEQKKIEEEYEELRAATVNQYWRLGYTMESPELMEELKELYKQEEAEIRLIYNRPMRGDNEDDAEY